MKRISGYTKVNGDALIPVCEWTGDQEVNVETDGEVESMVCIRKGDIWIQFVSSVDQIIHYEIVVK